MAKNIFRVLHPAINNKTGRQYFTLFECDYASIDELAAALSKGWVIGGVKLLIRRGEGNETEVYGREPFALAAAGVASIVLPRDRFVEYEEEAA